MASMHRFPRESGLATAYCAYFVSYLICDLGLGMVYYRDFVDPLSGWAHHLFYLGVMSRATAQGNISTLFAMGTPIEVSTIFLATGHIFPTLRSDVVFATSFFLARIAYPIVLLPELILNVESRLCWKVGAMALLVHVYWFYKFIQQQLRYYHARQEQKQADVMTDVKMTEQSATTTVTHKSEEDESLKIQTQSEDLKKTGNEYEYDVAAAVPVGKSVEVKTPESPVAANEMFGTDLSAVPLIQVNSSRHRRPRTPTDNKDGANIPAITFTSPAITRTPSRTIAAAAAVATTSSVTTKAAKTMKELLEECSDEDISTYRFPIHSNKTLSALARKPLNSSQGLSSNGDLGVVRLSRASSMRDSKRRIALGAVQFASPSSSVVGEPKARKMEDEPSVKNVEVVEEKNEEETMKKGSMKKMNGNNMDADATVVMRPRRSSPSRDGDYGFGTIRVSPRGGVVAVNA
ncbi:hypothetical protein BGZ95_009874 [Linnemannia exigua]|uniref:TLC domain-containing protein n=1 Tax=Linnemannia exigua TaxID=604196 RepID=A0AAD4DCH0_9FUNG|nr:hypothetical protein BGZ95_009874 [Linnemannia exigua]